MGSTLGLRRAALFFTLGACFLAAPACSSGNNANTGGSSSSSTSTSSAGGTGGGGAMARGMDPPITVDLQNRAYDLVLPTNFDMTKPAPLFLELHGFVAANDTMTPWSDEESANKFQPEADKRGIIFVLAHGNLDPTIEHFFWNGTDACCDLDDLKPNDIGYLAAIIEDVKSKYMVDDKRIFAFGHSNGGFMINRLACDLADKIAGVVSLAGETYKDQTKCAASAPIAYLQVQGDADMTVPYAGGHPENVQVLPIAPGAVETTQDWSVKNRCDIHADTSQPPIDIVADIDGAETNKLVYKNCEGNGQTELWTMHGGPHSPNFGPAWAPAVFDFLMAHPKP